VLVRSVVCFLFEFEFKFKSIHSLLATLLRSEDQCESSFKSSYLLYQCVSLAAAAAAAALIPVISFISAIYNEARTAGRHRLDRPLRSMVPPLGVLLIEMVAITATFSAR
jgi:hypothetical protein